MNPFHNSLNDPARLNALLSLKLLDSVAEKSFDWLTRLVRQFLGVRFRLEVRDTGIGIAPAHLRRLVAAFSQADDSSTKNHGGSGLGRAIARQLIELMGGKIGFKSDVKCGSTFSNKLELTPARNQVKSNPPLPETGLREGPALDRQCGLVAEDNESNQLVFMRLHEQLGHGCVVVPNGQATFDQLAHRLGGTCANLGAQQLHSTALRLEQAGSAGQWAESGILLSRFDQQWIETRNALQKISHPLLHENSNC